MTATLVTKRLAVMLGILALFWAPLALDAETVIPPANAQVILDGFGGEWDVLDGAPKMNPVRGAQLQLSHDHKHLLILASVPNSSHQPFPHDRMVIELHWDKRGPSSVTQASWEIGLNEYGRIDGKDSFQLVAAVRHDLLAMRTTYECAVPLSALPWNYKGLSLSVRFWNELSRDMPVAEWSKRPFVMNEFTKVQEKAGRILAETDFENLAPAQARQLITEVIPSVGNTRSGASALQKALNRTDYSGVDKAKVIARFLHKNPDNPLARSLILYLFRTRLGTLGWEKSLNVVKAVTRSAKVPREQVYDGIRPHYGNKPELVVRGWQVVGPFPFDQESSRSMTNLPPDLKTITLRESYTIKGKRLAWKPVEFTEKNFCDLRKTLASQEHGKAYAVTWVNSATAQPAALEFHGMSPAKVWINSRNVRISTGSRDEVPIQLNQGWNQILVESDSVATGKQSGAANWEFQMLLLHPLGMGKVPFLKMFGQ